MNQNMKDYSVGRSNTKTFTTDSFSSYGRGGVSLYDTRSTHVDKRTSAARNLLGMEMGATIRHLQHHNRFSLSTSHRSNRSNESKSIRRGRRDRRNAPTRASIYRARNRRS